jgi:putative protease
MLAYKRKIAAYLLDEGKPPLPFNPGELILTLDPFFPQSMEATLADEIPLLMEKGYRQFVVNNPGHFSYFRNTGFAKPPLLIAGPYLYIFNQWAESLVAAMGADYFISPLENNRQNLERTLPRQGAGGGRRSLAFVTVFAWPALFRIRADLGQAYNFGKFEDSRGESFSLVSDSGGSQVLPETPFSIVDKIPFLREAGFDRFILDFSGPVLKKKDYKDIMDAVKNAAPLPGVSRFNWKDGFFQNENKQ